MIFRFIKMNPNKLSKIHFSFWTLFLLFGAISCSTQTTPAKDRIVGGPCQGCEVLLDYPKDLKAAATIPGFDEISPKIKLSGTVYASDQKTPQPGVIIYLYQTDRNGIYNSDKSATSWAEKHGPHKGWVTTDDQGEYTFYTFRPAAYPNGETPEHIHLTIKENGMIPYYIDSVVFTDDPLLTPSEIRAHENRGGSGIATPKLIDGMLNVKRDIILGLNIPDYTK